jgi:1-acyl-sn-glycerol-3-phosphate acyltransferase
MHIKNMIFRQWRICATGLSFATFMLGGLFLTLTVFPIIRLLPLSNDRKQRRILLLIHRSFKFFMKYMKWLKPIEAFDVECSYNIKEYEPCILVANHPTLIDIIAIMSCIPFCNCIIKKSIWEHFYLGGVVRAAGYIVNNNARRLLYECKKSFETGRSLIIFPEGTRSPAYGLHPFNRGAAQIALHTGIPVVPIVITCNYATLLKGQPWYKVPEHPLRLKLQFHPPLIPPKEIQEEERFPIKVRVLNQYFEDFFREKLRLNLSTPDSGGMGLTSPPGEPTM